MEKEKIILIAKVHPEWPTVKKDYYQLSARICGTSCQLSITRSMDHQILEGMEKAHLRQSFNDISSLSFLLTTKQRIRLIIIEQREPNIMRARRCKLRSNSHKLLCQAIFINKFYATKTIQQSMRKLSRITFVRRTTSLTSSLISKTWKRSAIRELSQRIWFNKKMVPQMKERQWYIVPTELSVVDRWPISLNNSY